MKKLFWMAALFALAAPFVHPFGAVRQRPAAGPLPGDARARPVLERACVDCHSQRTRWPIYSYLPVLSWALEKDVAEARRHMDLSRWDQYSAEQKRDLLARIGIEVRSHQMPLPRYLALHPAARLSEADIQAIYDWTKAERHALRKQRE
jgi:cytochrome c